MPEYVSYTYKCYPQTGGGAHGITKSTKKPAGMKRGMHLPVVGISVVRRTTELQCRVQTSQLGRQVALGRSGLKRLSLIREKLV
jgi:hypothetical protein